MVKYKWNQLLEDTDIHSDQIKDHINNNKSRNVVMIKFPNPIPNSPDMIIFWMQKKQPLVSLHLYRTDLEGEVLVEHCKLDRLGETLMKLQREYYDDGLLPEIHLGTRH